MTVIAILSAHEQKFFYSHPTFTMQDRSAYCFTKYVICANVTYCTYHICEPLPKPYVRLEFEKIK